MLSLLEESLADPLVHDDQGDLWSFLLVLFINVVSVKSVLKGNYLVELSQLLINDQLAHRITHTVSVDENMLWHLAIEVSVALESTLEVVRENTRRDNLLTFDRLRASLRIILAEVRIVCCTEANSTLFAFVADIDAN